MSADNLRENIQTKNTPSNYEAFITFLNTFGYGYKSHKGSDGFENDNDKFRLEIVKYIKRINQNKIDSPETVATLVIKAIFNEFSKGNLKLNFLRKIIDDERKNGQSDEKAEIYANQLVSSLFRENSQTLNDSQIKYLKNKFNGYWITITNHKCLKLLPKNKVERDNLRIVSLDENWENPDKSQFTDILPAKIKNPEEKFLLDEYLEIYRKCLSKHLPELKKKYFTNLREDYFSILVRRYFSKEITNQEEIDITPEEIIKSKNFVFRTLKFLWTQLGRKAEEYQKITGESLRSHDDTRGKTADYLGITLNDFDNKVSKAKSFLAVRMAKCLGIKIEIKKTVSF